MAINPLSSADRQQQIARAAFETRADAMAAHIPDYAEFLDLRGERLQRALTGAALNTADGAGWAPVGPMLDVTLFGVTAGGSPATNIARLNAAMAAHGAASYFFPAASVPYRFASQLLPVAGASLVGFDRENTVLMWDNLTPCIDDSAGVDRVYLTGLTFTNGFDITQHDIGGSASVNGQWPLISSAGSDWVIRDCKFTNTYRQCLRPIGGANRWLVDGNIFIDSAREAFFAGSGTGFGHRVVNNHMENCGDDTVNFRNHHCCIFANNYVKQEGLNRATPTTGQGNSGQSNAALKSHGSYNLFIGNTFASGGNRILEVRASNPGTGEGAEGGAPVGNIFAFNTVRLTKTVREGRTQAIAIAPSEGGTNYFLDNHIDWIENVPAIAFIEKQEGWPVDLPIAKQATNCVIRGNTINSCSVPILIRQDARANRVLIEGNTFTNISTPAIVLAEDGRSAEIEEMVCRANNFRFGAAVGDIPAWVDMSANPDCSIKVVRFLDNLSTRHVLDLMTGNFSALNLVTTAEFLDNSPDYKVNSDNLPRRAARLLVKNRGQGVRRLVYMTSTAVPVSVTVPTNVAEVGVMGDTPSRSVKFLARFTPSLDAQSLFTGGSVSLFSDGRDLATTAGTAGRINVSVRNGALQIANDTGSGQLVRVTML